jgi:hypothetical protein
MVRKQIARTYEQLLEQCSKQLLSNNYSRTVALEQLLEPLLEQFVTRTYLAVTHLRASPAGKKKTDAPGVRKHEQQGVRKHEQQGVRYREKKK